MYLCYKGEMKPHGSVIVDKGIIFEDPEKAFEWALELSKDWLLPASRESLPITPEGHLFCADLEIDVISKLCVIQHIKIGELFNLHYHEYSIKEAVTEPIIKHIDKVFRELKEKPVPKKHLDKEWKECINDAVTSTYSESVQSYSDVWEDEPSSQEWAKIPKEERKLYRNDESNFEGWKKVLAERKLEEKRLDKEIKKSAIETGKITVTDFDGIKKTYEVKDFPRVQLKKKTANEYEPIAMNRDHPAVLAMINNSNKNTGIFNP